MEKRDFQILTIYNDEQLLKHKNREIALIRKVLRVIPSKSKKKVAKNPLPHKK